MATTVYGITNTHSPVTKPQSSWGNDVSDKLELIGVRLAQVFGKGAFSPTDFSPSDGGSGTINISTGVAIVGDAGSEKVVRLSTITNVANPGNGTWYIELSQSGTLAASASATPAANVLQVAQVVIAAGAYSSGTAEIKTATGRKNLCLSDQNLHIAQATISTSQILALNATPQTIIPAPGAGFAIIIDWAIFFYDYNSVAYAGIAAGEDLALRYTGSAGTILAQCETTGFLDQTSDQTRIVYPYRAASGVSDVTPTANAVVVLHMQTGEIITGNSPLYVRVAYRIVPTTLP